MFTKQIVGDRYGQSQERKWVSASSCPCTS